MPWTAILVNDDEDLSPAIPVFHFAPKGIRPISQLHALIAVEINTDPNVMVFGEIESERLDSLAV